MRFFTTIASFLSLVAAAPLKIHSARDGNQLTVSVTNNFPGKQLNYYVTGYGGSNNGSVILATDGTLWELNDPSHFGALTKEAGSQPIPTSVAHALDGNTITIPDFISSGRIYFADGELSFNMVMGADGKVSIVEPSATADSDPASKVNWGFVELSYSQAELYANISFVDWVGLAIGMGLTTTSGGTQSVPGLLAGKLDSICADLKAQSQTDSWQWDKLCVQDGSGNNLRALSPSDYIQKDATAFQGYWANAVNAVWARYANEPLRIDTQSEGVADCKVEGDVLNCRMEQGGDDVVDSYQRPNDANIFGCNTGPFANIPGSSDIHQRILARLCAAFHRGTLLLPSGNVQPDPDSNDFYPVDGDQAWTNHYSRVVHKYEADGRGYAFAFDDVVANGAMDVSGFVNAPDPVQLSLTVGGA